jgi:hypothetical protein
MAWVVDPERAAARSSCFHARGIAILTTYAVYGYHSNAYADEPAGGKCSYCCFSSAPVARWASPPVAAPARERQPGALAGGGGSGREQAHRRVSPARQSRAVSRSRQSPPTVDDAAVTEVGEERDQDEMDARFCFGVGTGIAASLGGLEQEQDLRMARDRPKGSGGRYGVEGFAGAGRA